MTRLIIVRHGETEANVEKVWQGALDAPLTPQGEAQVRATAQRVSLLHHELPINHIYVSPLPRTQSTAQAIVEATGIAPILCEGLREFDLGEWEGRTFRDLAETDRLWERWQADPSFAPPNGESPVSFSRRVVRTFEELVRTHPDETLLIVTHGGVISNLLANWLGEGGQDWTRWDPPNCAVTVLDQQDRGWHVICVNDIEHLREVGVVVDDWSDLATQ